MSGHPAEAGGSHQPTRGTIPSRCAQSGSRLRGSSGLQPAPGSVQLRFVQRGDKFMVV